LEEQKIYLFDRFGINSFWERSYDGDKLEVINNITAEIINKIKTENILLVFVNYEELENFYNSESFTPDIEHNIRCIDDCPELLSIGFKKYYLYDDIASVPNTRVLGDRNSVTLTNIVFAVSDGEIGEKKIISLGGQINGNDLFLRNERFSLMVGHNSKLIFGRNCRIGENINITLEKNCIVEIDDDCALCNGTSISARSSSIVNIGKNCVFNNVSIDVFCNISIGNNCVVAPEVSLRDGDGHDILGLDSPNYPKPIKIGNSVWLGKNAKILKGVEIGNNCVIGTGSIVSKSFSENLLIAGVPAKVLRTGITWRPDYSFYRKMQEVISTHQWPFI